MSRPLLSACCVLALALGCDRARVIVEEPEPASAPAAPLVDPLVEEEALRDAVRDYATALDARDAELASARVVADTFVYYDDLRRAALRADREQLERWDLMSVILVLQIRASSSRAQLEALDGRGLFERAVSEGLVGEGVAQISLDEVWIADAGDRAEVRIEGEPVVWLRRDMEADPPGPWQVDIPQSIRVLGPALEALAREKILADGKARTAMTFVEVSAEDWIDVAILDGPLEQIGDSGAAP